LAQYLPESHITSYNVDEHNGSFSFEKQILRPGEIANFMADCYVNIIGYRSYRKEMDLQSADHRFLKNKPWKHLYWALEKSDETSISQLINLGVLTAVQTTF
jgi:hypothetical protein